MANEEDNRTPDKMLTAKMTTCVRQEIISLSDEYLGEREVNKSKKKKVK